MANRRLHSAFDDTIPFPIKSSAFLPNMKPFNFSHLMIENKPNLAEGFGNVSDLRSLNEIKSNANKEAVNISLVNVLLIDADLLLIWINNFQFGFCLPQPPCLVLPSMPIIL